MAGRFREQQPIPRPGRGRRRRGLRPRELPQPLQAAVVRRQRDRGAILAAGSRRGSRVRRQGARLGLAHESEPASNAFDARGCGKASMCEPLKFVQASRSETYFGAPLAIGRDRVVFVSTRSETLESAVSVLALH